MTNIELTGRLRAAADYIDAHGWTRRTEQDNAGRVCLTGAVRYCAPQTGDEYLIRAVLRARNRAEAWNDRLDRTADDVVGYLRSAEITDADLADTFGPQWKAIVALIRRAASLTPDQTDDLAAAWNAARVAAWGAARDAARVAARGAARDAAQDAAWVAAWDAARTAAGVAAWALAVRDLIGQDGFTQDHYDTLTGPWAKVIGPAHPDDTKDNA